MRDASSGEQPRKTPLPLSMDEVTPEWLTHGLQARFPGVRVASTTRQGERAGTSMSAQFNLVFDDRGGHADLPDSVYIKGGFDEVMRRRVWMGLIQEAQFFAEWASQMPVNIPLCHFADWDVEARQGVVILEDMAPRGVRFGYATDVLSVDDVARIIEGQAKYHARFWADPRLQDYRDWADPQRAFLRYLMRDKMWDQVEERPYAPLLNQLFSSRAQARACSARLWEINDAMTPTLVHGDCHSGNLFYEADGSPGFLDWQCVFPGVPGHDHNEMLCTTLTIEDRRRSERDLIKHYRAELVANGVKDAPTADELFFSYRQNIMHNVNSASWNPYDMQVPLVTDQSATRTLTAALDLDTVGALGLRG